MKKLMMTLVAMLTIAASGKAMSYEQARNEALFLTDKMAYELNLTDEQYEAAYEINLDYLMGVTSYDDVFGTYWERRNLDLSYVMLDWQWELFRAATYFYRPLYWEGGYWHFGIYARYPYRDYFYFGRPVFYASYRGGHAWHRHGAHGYYYGHRDQYHGHHGKSHFGMLDRWNRGDYRNSSHHFGDRGHHNGGYRNSSTRTTVNDHHHGTRPGEGSHTRPGGGTNTRPGGEGRPSGGSFGGHRDPNSTTGSGRPSTSNRPSTDSRPLTTHARPDRSTLTSRPERSTITSRPERSTTMSRPSSSVDRSSHSSGSFSRSSSSSSHSSGSFSRSSGSSSHSSGSFSRGSGSSSHSSGSFSRGGGSGSHSGGGHSSSGGRSFGGRR